MEWGDAERRRESGLIIGCARARDRLRKWSWNELTLKLGSSSQNLQQLIGLSPKTWIKILVLESDLVFRINNLS